jgi:hypothetical protein
LRRDNGSSSGVIAAIIPGGGFAAFKIAQWAKSNDYDKDESGF